MTYQEGLAKLEGRARLATIVLWVFLAAATLSGFGAMLETAGVVDIALDTGALATLVGVAYLVYAVAFFVSVVFVGRWIHCAHATLHERGIEGLEFTPGWAIGWYFVPFANLVKPFQAMRELWIASHSEIDRFGAEAPYEIKVWWAAWIVGNILSTVSTRILLLGEGGPSAVTLGNALAAASNVTDVVAALLLLRIVARVTEAQRGGLTAAAVFA